MARMLHMLRNAAHAAHLTAAYDRLHTRRGDETPSNHTWCQYSVSTVSVQY
jgi:hypothetical protein